MPTWPSAVKSERMARVYEKILPILSKARVASIIKKPVPHSTCNFLFCFARETTLLHRKVLSSWKDNAIFLFSDRESICIGYDAVNSAFAKARDAMRLTSPARGKEPSDMEVDLLGRTLVETSRILAEQ